MNQYLVWLKNRVAEFVSVLYAVWLLLSSEDAEDRGDLNAVDGAGHSCLLNQVIGVCSQVAGVVLDVADKRYIDDQPGHCCDARGSDVHGIVVGDSERVGVRVQ